MAEHDWDASPRFHPQPVRSDFAVAETWVDGLVVVSVAGSVDMLTAPRLTEAIDSALAKRPTGMVVDLSNVEFLASAGISVLMATHGNAGHSGRFGVVADGPATHRPLKLLGLAEIISVHTTLDDALSKLANA
jgi:anti-sigma B factor antagonist